VDTAAVAVEGLSTRGGQGVANSALGDGLVGRAAPDPRYPTHSREGVPGIVVCTRAPEMVSAGIGTGASTLELIAAGLTCMSESNHRLGDSQTLAHPRDGFRT